MNPNLRIVTILALLFCGTSASAGQPGSQKTATTPPPAPTKARVLFLHHSTGECIWNGGVKEWFDAYNKANKTEYEITQQNFPKDHPYGWNNYPYDYWNIWVKNAGNKPFKDEPTLEMLTPKYDVIIFKHCFPVSAVEEDAKKGDVSQEEKTVANYKLQYEALKKKLKEYPKMKFIVWTGAALIKKETDENAARRAKAFFDWVRQTWDQPGDNIFLWDFRELETEGELYLRDAYAAGDSHPNEQFSKKVAPLFGQRVVDVIAGNGDTGSIKGTRGKDAGAAQPPPPKTDSSKAEPAASTPTVKPGADAWVFDDAEDPARLAQLWGQGVSYAVDGKKHLIKVPFAKGREEDWGEYGPHRVVVTIPPKKNFDIAPYRYLAFRVRADRDMEVILKITTKPDNRPSGEESCFWFAAYPKTKAGAWEWVVLDLSKLELNMEGEAAYQAEGKPTRPQRLTGFQFATNKRNEAADVAIDDIVFYRVLPKELADKVEAP